MSKITPQGTRAWPLLIIGAAAVWYAVRRKPTTTATSAAAPAMGENRYLRPIQAGEDPYTRRRSDMTAQLSTGWINPTPGGI